MSDETPKEPPIGEDSAASTAAGDTTPAATETAESAQPAATDISSTAADNAAGAAPAADGKATAAATKTEADSGEPSKPKTSKSLVLTGYGGYDKIKVQQKPYPDAPKAGQIMVKVQAAGINFADIALRQGLYHPLPASLPVVMGLEASGDVIQVGPEVKEFKEGDKVICFKSSGLWSEYVTLDILNCVPMPTGMTYEEAAALPVNYITAYHILFDFGNLRSGKSVLIHMAAGGVGIAATQLCKTVPDVVIYGTASLSKHEAIQQNGVDHPINYRSVDYAEEIRKIDPEGVDIVMDPLSGKDAAKGFDLLKPLGKIIHFGAANFVTGTSKSYWNIMKTYMGLKSYNSLQLIDKNKAICGYHLGYLVDQPKLIRSTLDSILELFKAGKIKPHIDSVWAFEDVGLAMARIHERANIGKVILSPGKESQLAQKK